MLPQTLETDTLYKEQNGEIARLTEELVQLKARLGDMEQELQRAGKIIEEQSAKIRKLEDDRGSMHAKFREELDKVRNGMHDQVQRGAGQGEEWYAWPSSERSWTR